MSSVLKKADKLNLSLSLSLSHDRGYSKAVKKVECRVDFELKKIDPIQFLKYACNMNP